LPFCKLPVNQRHFLFCDSTWNISQKYNKNNFTKKFLKDAERLEKKSFQQVKHIFSISEHVKNNLVGHYGINENKITVVGTGIGAIKPFFGKKNYSNGKILFVAKGGFERKGGPLVLKAFNIALKINPTLELIIVGQDKYLNTIKLPKVKSYGYLPFQDLQNIFNESSLFLMPANYEPWGLVYLEALACKISIVGLNRNSFPEISDFGKYGFGIDIPDDTALAQVIINAFENPQKLETMGNTAQE